MNNQDLKKFTAEVAAKQEKQITSLIDLVTKQQKIINALAKKVSLIKQAQSAAAPAPDQYGTHEAPGSKVAPPHAVPGAGGLTRDLEGEAIIKMLPAVVKAAIRDLKTVPSRDPNFDKVVKVFFHPGKDSDAAFNAVQKVITALQQQNVLKGKSYQVMQA